jgi:hypothetical protein
MEAILLLQRYLFCFMQETLPEPSELGLEEHDECMTCSFYFIDCPGPWATYSSSKCAIYSFAIAIMRSIRREDDHFDEMAHST